MGDAPTRAFHASLTFYDPLPAGVPPSAAVQTNLRTLTVAVQASASKKLAPLPYTPDGIDPPSSANVFLQIWEVEKYEKAKKKNDGVEPANHLLTEVPGFIQELPKGKGYEFRLLGAAPTNAPGAQNLCGYFWLALKDASGNPWPTNVDSTSQSPTAVRPFTVLIYGDCEDEVDLSASLEAQAGTSTHGDAGWEDMSVFHVTNMTHILMAQADEGGLTITLWLDAVTKEELAKANAELAADGDLPSRSDYNKWATAAKAKHPWAYNVVNDSGFPGFAAAAANRLHAVTADDHGQLMLGQAGNGFTKKSEIFPKAKRILDAVAATPILSWSNPCIYRLMLCTHGWQNGKGGIRTGHDGADQILGGDIPTFFAPFVPVLHPNAIVTLFACLTAQSESADCHDKTFRGQTNLYQGFGFPPAVGSQLGKGSFAGILFEWLCDQLKVKDDGGKPWLFPGPVVWAHCTAGPAINNGTFRIFAKRYDQGAAADQYPDEGGRDLYWAKDGSPPWWLGNPGAALPEKLADKLAAFVGNLSKLDNATLQLATDIATSRPGSDLQQFLANVPANLFPPPPPPSQPPVQKTAENDAGDGPETGVEETASNDPAAGANGDDDDDDDDGSDDGGSSGGASSGVADANDQQGHDDGGSSTVASNDPPQDPEAPADGHPDDSPDATPAASSA